MNDKIQAHEAASASVIRGAGHGDEIRVRGRFNIVCLGPDGQEKWRDHIDNLVTTVGKNDILDKYLKGSSYTQTFRMGLAGAGTKAAGDTQNSHAGWSELTAYTGNRKDVTMGNASSGSSVSPTQAFAVTGPMTVAGCFTNNGGSSTKSDTSGTLFSAGDFSGGSKGVDNGDTLNVTYTLSV